MDIAHIPGATRTIGEGQGYLGLPLRDEPVHCTVNGPATPSMVTAWLPTPDEVTALMAGAAIYVRILGTAHPPIMLGVGPAGEGEGAAPAPPSQPEPVRVASSLEEVGTTDRGYVIFREPNEVGGHRYWSDEIGGGVVAWDTSLVDAGTLRECLRIEAGAELPAPPDREQMERDIGLLLATIDCLAEAVGEGPEGEDAAIVAQIRADHERRLTNTPAPQPGGAVKVRGAEAEAEAFKAGALADREVIAKHFQEAAEDSEKWMKKLPSGSPAWCTHANNAAEAGRVIASIRALPLPTPPAGEG